MIVDYECSGKLIEIWNETDRKSEWPKEGSSREPNPKKRAPSET